MANRDVPDDVTSLPPIHLDLDDVPPATADHASESGAPWRRWLVGAVILAVGVAVGVVANNANDAAGDAGRADLVAGRPTMSTPWVHPDHRPVMRGQFPLFNAGPLAVDVLDVAMTGWARPEDASAGGPITVEPGTWAVAATVVEPDCDREPGGIVEVTVRTSSGERRIHLETPPTDARLRWAWHAGCTPGPLIENGFAVGFDSWVGHDDNGSLQVRAELHWAGAEAITVTSVVSRTPGLAIDTETPVRLQPDTSHVLTLSWRILDCSLAETMREGTMAFVFSDRVGGEGERSMIQRLDGPLLVELTRFVLTACDE